MNPIERRIKALGRMIGGNRLSEDRLMEIFLNTRSDEELDILEYIAKMHGEGSEVDADIFSALDVQMAAFMAVSTEDLLRLDEMDRSTEGFAERLGPEDAEWLRKFGFNRELWVAGEDEDGYAQTLD